MFSNQKGAQKPGSLPASENGQPAAPAIPLLSVVGERARMEGKFDIADSIQVECEVGGELNVGSKLVIGKQGVVNANVRTADALIGRSNIPMCSSTSCNERGLLILPRLAAD